MKKIITKALPAFLLAFTAPTLMAADKKPLSYNYIEFGANYTKDAHKSKTDESAGAHLNLSFDIGPNGFLLLGLEGEQTKKDKTKTATTKTERFGRAFTGHFGFGGYAPMLDNLDLVGEILYLRSEGHGIYKQKNTVNSISINDKAKTKDNGWSAGLGVRSVFANWFELNGFVRHADIFNEKNTIYTVGTKAHMSLFSLGLDVSEYHTRSKRSATHVDLTARFSF